MIGPACSTCSWPSSNPPSLTTWKCGGSSSVVLCSGAGWCSFSTISPWICWAIQSKSNQGSKWYSSSTPELWPAISWAPASLILTSSLLAPAVEQLPFCLSKFAAFANSKKLTLCKLQREKDSCWWTCAQILSWMHWQYSGWTQLIGSLILAASLPVSSACCTLKTLSPSSPQISWYRIVE